MKSRSHRIASSDPHDDWINGSWTVDCVCGVNFDDGKEMVNCDECGVWVHTRCSRYVKGEKLFACDKCKSKDNKNDSEETEVAQLLVELPTKTLIMENSYRLSEARQPVRLWSDIPMEDRVHAQGIPGGDPGMFGKLSSVFTPQLWKCAGYVPKKFNLQYREYPCWDDKEVAHTKTEEESVDKGADVLFSLSKKMETAHFPSFVGTRCRLEEAERKVSVKEVKWEYQDEEVRCTGKGLKKDRTSLRSSIVQSAKRKKEELGASKDPSGRKARVHDNDAGASKRPHLPKPVFDAIQMAPCEEKSPMFVKSENQNVKIRNSRNIASHEPVFDGNILVGNNLDKPKNQLAVNGHLLEAFGCSNSLGEEQKQEKIAHQVPTKVDPKVDVSPLLIGDDGVGYAPVKEEGVSITAGRSDDKGDISSSKLKHSSENVAIFVSKVNAHDTNGGAMLGSEQPYRTVDNQLEYDASKGTLNFQSSPLGEAKLAGMHDLSHLGQHGRASADRFCDVSELNDFALSNSLSRVHNAQHIQRRAEVVSKRLKDNTGELAEHYSNQKQDFRGSSAVNTTSSEPKNAEKQSAESPNSDGRMPNPALVSRQKEVVNGGQSSSNLSVAVIPASSIAENGKPENAQKSHPISKRLAPIFKASMKKLRDSIDEDGQEMPTINTVKERLQSTVVCAFNASHSSRSVQDLISRQPMSKLKDHVVFSSSRISSAEKPIMPSGSAESAGSCRSMVQGHNKMMSSSLSQKGEKMSPSNGHHSSNADNGQAKQLPAPSNSAAVLSDEELALLLHQELNSSPRVPRVPRVRQSGSLPQLNSSPATSTLIKRTSSSGGKDYTSLQVSKRKSKDSLKCGLELDDEVKKIENITSFRQRRQDLAYPSNALSRKEADNKSLKADDAAKKNIPSASLMAAKSSPSSSVEVNCQTLSSVCNSPRIIANDESGIIGGPAHHTLPGLINEIMRKGERMTYEELCDAVLPHWQNLRKLNGERYAYASHSQAVLDCLRNRSEWAQLVDRGPKTNVSRKRRKQDAEHSGSEDSKHGKSRTAKESESSKSLEPPHREEFPKGKRNLRKGRKLALRGRGAKNIRKRKQADVLTDDDFGPFSNSSEESVFSEDEIQPAGSDVSASSDGEGSML